jgi:hypothetical protein
MHGVRGIKVVAATSKSIRLLPRDGREFNAVEVYESHVVLKCE